MLKLLACLFMLIDHIGYYFDFLLPPEIVLLLRTVGRLAFPIFAWSVARGFSRTRNPVRYFIRMSLFAILSEIVIRLANNIAGLSGMNINVMATFALAIVLISGYRLATHSYLDMVASLRPISPTPQTLPTPPRYDVRVNVGGIELDPRIGLPFGVLMMLATILAALWLQPDYELYGLSTVLLFYIIHDRVLEKDREKRAIQGFILLNVLFLPIHIFLNHWSPDSAVLQCFAIVALLLCYRLDREKKPSPAVKYAFYLFYPLHILLLCLIRTLF